MGTYKKKHFKKKFKEEFEEEENLDEFYGDDTEMGGGDDFSGEVTTDTPFTGDEEAEQGIPQITRDKAKIGHGARSFWYYAGFPTNSGNRVVSEGEKILAKERMENLIEDLLSDRKGGNDFVRGNNPQDFNRNKIPDIEDITNINQALANKTKEMIRVLGNLNLSGDDTAILLNFIVSNIGVSDISQKDKDEIKGKI